MDEPGIQPGSSQGTYFLSEEVDGVDELVVDAEVESDFDGVEPESFDDLPLAPPLFE